MKTTTISDLPQDLVEEILCRTPLSSLSAVRLTSKQWNALSKNQIVCKAEPKQQFLGFMILNCRIFSLRLNLKRDDDGSYSNSSIKKIGKLDRFEISRVYHCDGLVLCLTFDESKLVAWNPYLGKTRLIELCKIHYMYKYNYKYDVGYDSSRSYKILRFITLNGFRTIEFEIYDFRSDSWRVLDLTPHWCINTYCPDGLSLKGNTYWIGKDIEGEEEDFLLCFDFTTERFGPRLKLPFHDNFDGYGPLACVREEKLAAIVMHEDWLKMEIWVTTKVEPEFVSWSKFLVFDSGTNRGLWDVRLHGGFFIDEEKKVAWLFSNTVPRDMETPRRRIAYVVGEDGYYKEVYLGESTQGYCPMVCSYIPSLVQIEPKGKEKKNLLLSRRV